jgi:site-specific recombinase XerD
MAAKQKDYYDERDRKNLKKIQELIEQLPPFAEDYFMGIEQRTSVETRLKYAYDLRIFFDFLVKTKFRQKRVAELTLDELGTVSEMDIERFLSALSLYTFNGKELCCDERSKARKLSAVRSMFKYFFRHSLIDVDNTAKVETPKVHEKEIIRLESNEVSELLDNAETGNGLSKHAVCYHNRTRVRDLAILTLFLGTGIRISELVGLDNTSFDFTNNSFVVRRKGGNRMILYFSEEVAIALKAYIEEKAGDPKIPQGENAFFLSLQYKRMTVRAVEMLVKKYARIVTPLKKITPHKLRSTYGTMLYRETGDIYIVADVLGHKDVNTTKKHYAAISEDSRKKVAGKVKLRKDEDNQ